MIFKNGKKATGIIIVVLILILAGYWMFRHQPPVMVILVKKGEIQGKVHGPGTVQSRVAVTV